MSLRLPTRTFLPVIVLAVLGGVVATFMVARPPSSTVDETPVLVRPKRATPAKPGPARKATPAKTSAKPKAQARRNATKPAAKPVRGPVAKPKPVPAPAAKPAAAAPKDELPKVLSAALAKNRVVVVGLYDPDSAVDRISLEEARAGAQAAGAGFVAIDVFAEAQARPLVELLGALENPGILVYRKPKTLFARISGFADSETVAQAATNARR